MDSWQDISTAPRDGTLMWLLAGGEPVIGHFRRPYLELHNDTGDWRISAIIRRRERPNLDDGIALTSGVICPTKWMPLPAPPGR